MKKFVNFRFVVTLVLAVFANVVTYAQDNVVDEVVWVVGDEAILKSDVEEARMDALYNGRRFDGDPYCVIPEEIAHIQEIIKCRIFQFYLTVFVYIFFRCIYF